MDAPAFGASAAKTEDTSETTTADVSQTESGESKEQGTSAPEPVVDEQRVPYSRFSKMRELAREAEARAEEAEARYLESLRAREERNVSQETISTHYKGDLPGFWVKLYGDSEASREAYAYELQRQNQIREEARRDAVEAVRAESQYERQTITANENEIDNRLDDLGSYLGRDLTPKEEDKLLDIIDEYTPKDANGMYAGDLISFDKAWEIYEMREGQSAAAGSRSRRQATALTSSRSEGEPSGDEKQKSDFDPRDWNAYRRRI
jgi:hypothetical protein